MSDYLSWNKATTDNFEGDFISTYYAGGYVFTRISKGLLNQTRSLRINLEEFEFSSENRRILTKVENLKLEAIHLPLSEEAYSWTIHKLAKDFYTTKFGDKTFSAAKIKELVTDGIKSNFNLLLKYTEGEEIVGYTIAYHNSQLLHYAYPFYDLNKFASNYGMGMMLKAIEHAKEEGKKFFYIGSATRPADKYKLQFKGLEWFDGQAWQRDLEALKTFLQ